MNQTLPSFPTYFTPPSSFASSPGFDGTAADFYGLPAQGFDTIESDGASSGGFDLSVDRQASANLGFFSANQAALNYSTHAYTSRSAANPLHMSSFTYPASRHSPSSATTAQGYLDMPGPSSYAGGTSYLQHQHQPRHGANGGTGDADDRLVKIEDARGRTNDDDDDESEDDDDEEGSGMVGLEGADGPGMGDEGDGVVDNEEPLYVNAKQYHRILKRRIARQRLEELNRLSRSRKPYLHESRHRHACSRPRGKGGRFLTADEIEALKKEQQAGKDDLDSRPSTAVESESA